MMSFEECKELCSMISMAVVTIVLLICLVSGALVWFVPERNKECPCPAESVG